MGNETSITTGNYYITATPINYGISHAKKSLAVAVTLLALACILFYTKGASQPLIIGFGSGIGATTIFGLVSLYYGTKLDRKISIENQTRNRNHSRTAVDVIKHQGPDVGTQYGVLRTDAEVPLNEDELIETIISIATTELEDNSTLKADWGGKLCSVIETIKARPDWDSIKQNPKLSPHLTFVQTIDSYRGA